MNAWTVTWTADGIDHTHTFADYHTAYPFADHVAHTNPGVVVSLTPPEREEVGRG